MSNIALVTVIVSDYDEAISFFVNILDFELVEDEPRDLTRWSSGKAWLDTTSISPPRLSPG